MRIVIAPDSFKETNSAIAVANTIEKGIRKVFPNAEIIKIPIADGGEGTVEAVVLGGGGDIREIQVTGPMGEKRRGRFGVLPGGRCVVEMAAASGLPLVPEGQRNPLLATTYGTGELIKAALNEGCRELMVGIGGSATNDAGIGMAQALGYSFLDADGHELGFGGGELIKLHRIDKTGVDSRISECAITVACDVDNPLYGERGAAYIYGPQKGADSDTVIELDRGLRHFSDIVKSQLEQDVSLEPGAGAAGGLGAGLMVFCGAQLKSGIESILDIVRFDSQLDEVDLVITGEGKIDNQSAFGKVPVGVARRARARNLPVLAIVGDIGVGAEAVYDEGIDAIMSTVNRAMPLKEALADSTALLEDAAERVMRILSIGLRLNE